MKKIINLLILSVFAVVIFSCRNDDHDPVLAPVTDGTLASDVKSVVLDEAKAASPAVKFTFTTPTFSTPVAGTQFLEFAAAGNSFNTAQQFTIAGEGNTVSVSNLDLNNIAVNLGLKPSEKGQIQVRLASKLGADTHYYSAPIILEVTPYAPNPDLVYPKINVPGGYAGTSGYTDWEPKNSPNLYSPGKNSKYYGFVYMNPLNKDAAQYKFTINEDWAGDKGDDGTFKGKLVEDGEVNIPVAVAPNTYYIKVDWAANTYSTVKANFGIIGEATPTGWDSDTKLQFNPVTHKFEITLALAANKPFKFRANDSWDIKILPNKNDQTLVSGKAVQTFTTLETVEGDASYMVSETGTYKVELDLHNSAFYNIKATKQ